MSDREEAWGLSPSASYAEAMDLIERVTTLLDSQNGRRDNTDGTSSRTESGLYRCSDCETTYVSETMDSCPECRGPVESIPNERDLGMR